MPKKSVIKTLRMTVAAGYTAGGLSSVAVLMSTGNRSLLLLAALPAVLQSIEMAVRWATGASTDWNGKHNVHPSPKRETPD